ncbi:MAG: hypothetical protein M1820_004785 [Bogoriella megaspora]|nr:MAG: hypothetical protein M1820_004785 [Bogoriella megaspora]
MLHLSPLFLVSLLPWALAQSTSSTHFFLLDTDPQPLVASVISANPSGTTFALTCPSGTDQNDCGYNPPISIIHQEDVWQGTLAAPEEQFTLSWSCSLIGTTTASCVESDGGEQANFKGITTMTFGSSDVGGAFFPVEITAGLEKLQETSSATASSRESTATAASGTMHASTGAGASPAGSATPTASNGAGQLAGLGYGTIAMGAALWYGLL